LLTFHITLRNGDCDSKDYHKWKQRCFPERSDARLCDFNIG
jgi:hypothetical protein